MEQEIKDRFREAFVEGLEDLVTDPWQPRGLDLNMDLPDRVRRGEKIDGSRTVLDRFTAVGHDLRLHTGELAVLRRIHFVGS